MFAGKEPSWQGSLGAQPGAARHKGGRPLKPPSHLRVPVNSTSRPACVFVF